MDQEEKRIGLELKAAEEFITEVKRFIDAEKEYKKEQEEERIYKNMLRELVFLEQFYLLCYVSKEERNQIKLDFLNCFKYLPYGFEIEEE